VAPNLLTLLRLILMPPILWLTSLPDTAARATALSLFLLAAFTDWLDGYIARTRDMITPFGTLMDPLADKILILGLLFVFVEIDILPLWLVLVMLFRELLVSGVRRVRAAEGEVIGANWMGKTKFVLQNLLVVGILICLILDSQGAAGENWRTTMYVAALTVMCVSVLFALNFLRWHLPELLKSSRG
jgi:CDP-diacylglycerol--glycerol-3-phosphate 3-phosphatidyltransferase